MTPATTKNVILGECMTYKIVHNSAFYFADGMVDDTLRSQLLRLLIPLGTESEAFPAGASWEQKTCDDADNPQATWGLTASALQVCVLVWALVTRACYYPITQNSPKTK